MKRRAILLAAVAVWCAAVALTWVAATRRAARQTESMLDYAMLDLDATLNGSIDTMLMHIGRSIVEELGAPGPYPEERMKLVAEQRDIDEVNVISREGVVVASSDRAQVGFPMAERKESAPFLVLTNGVRTAFSNPFRFSTHDTTVRRKYVGVAFPGGDGFVQIAVREPRVTAMFPAIMGFIFDGWLLGEKGFFLCADLGDGHLISNPARHRDEARFLAETGYDPAAPGVVEDAKTTFRATLFGAVHDCRAVVFCGHRIVAALPPAEYYGVRTLFTAVMGSLLAAVLGLFVALLWRIGSDAARIRAFYADKAAKQAAELELGRTIQSAALPSDFPDEPSFRLAASMRPAREVGGDFYDFFPLGETHRAFLVADVSGKGVTGALYMMNAKTLIRDQLQDDPARDPAAALSRANAELCRNNPAEMFVTAWVGVLDLRTGLLAFANAGHNPPLLLRAGEAPRWIREKSGCPLACFDGVAYRLRSLELSPGDSLLLYTDGVTEAMDPSGALFGEERLAATLADAMGGGTAPAGAAAPVDLAPPAAPAAGPVALDAAVRAAVAAFAAGAPQADDLTILAVQYRGAGAGESLRREFPCGKASLRAASDFLEEALDGAGCPTRPKMQLLMALDEITTNVVLYSGATAFAVDVRLGKAPRGAWVEVSDDGRAFDPLSLPPPDTTLPPERRKAGGLGVHLVRKTMDEVSYRRVLGHNVVSFRKDFA